MEIIVDASLLDLKLLVLVLRTLKCLVKLSNFPIGKLKFLLSALDISQDIVVGLVSTFDESLVELNLSFARL